MNPKVIIYGYSDFAKEFCVLLDAKFSVLIVEPEGKYFKQAVAEQKEVIKSALLDDEDMLQIGLDKADIVAFIVASHNSTNNLFVTLSARNLNSKLSIVCLSRSKQEDKQMKLAGASVVINPSKICGLRIARMISKPKVIEILDDVLFGTSTVNLHEYFITEHSRLNGQMLHDVDCNDFELIVFGLRDKELGDKFIFATLGINHKLDCGDVLVVAGDNTNFQRFVEVMDGI